MKNIIIGILAVGVVAAGVALIVTNQQPQQDTFDFNMDSFSSDSEDQLFESELGSGESPDQGAATQEPSTPPSGQQGGQQTMTVNIPSLDWNLASGATPEGYGINYTPVEVPFTTGVINATFEAFFDYHAQNAGSTMGSYYGLSYDSVVLDGGAAQVYLTGSYIPVGGMTGLFLNEEINAVVFQFENVHTIEVYLNGELWDWCDYDVAGPNEGPCATGPRYWIEQN